LFDAALEQACELPESYAAISASKSGFLLIFRCYDRITGNLAQPRSIIYGVISEAESIHILKDWQVLQALNEFAGTLKPMPDSETAPGGDPPPGKLETLTRAESVLREALPSLDLPFRQPELELLGIAAGIGQTTRAPASNL
jgi:hypothetical protein